jgi:hypothetical protein
MNDLNLNIAAPEHVKLDNLGKNRNDQPIRAMAIDTMFLCPPNLSLFGVNASTHHQQKFADILFSDGHTLTQPNADGRYTVNLITVSDLSAAFSKILTVFEQADTVP